MIEFKDVNLNYIKKEILNGSDKGMRYRLQKNAGGETEELLTVIWPEPYCFRKTPEAQKQTARFPFTNEGLQAAVDWMNEQQVTCKNQNSKG